MQRLISITSLLGLVVMMSGCELGAAGNGLRISLGREAETPFEWQGQLAEGQTVEIKGINGSVVAEPAEGDEVVVRAERRAFRSDPDLVTIEVVEHDGGVTIRAIYPDTDSQCEPGADSRLRARNNDTKVEFVVQVPSGLTFAGRTVNGSVKANDLEGDVVARTTNGSVNIATTGNATARTTNGSIRATIGTADWDGEASFETTNGSVTLEVPEGIDANLNVRTVNGSIKSDIPMEVTESGRRRLEATLGDGGRDLRITTTNGSVKVNAAGD